MKHRRLYQAFLFCLFLALGIVLLHLELSGEADVVTRLACAACVGSTLACIASTFGIRKALFGGLCVMVLLAPLTYRKLDAFFDSWPLAFIVTIIVIAALMLEWAGVFLMPDEEKKTPEGEQTEETR